jgi:hypothetical protein
MKYPFDNNRCLAFGLVSVSLHKGGRWWFLYFAVDGDLNTTKK